MAGVAPLHDQHHDAEDQDPQEHGDELEALSPRESVRDRNNRRGEHQVAERSAIAPPAEYPYSGKVALSHPEQGDVLDRRVAQPGTSLHQQAREWLARTETAGAG